MMKSNEETIKTLLKETYYRHKEYPLLRFAELGASDEYVWRLMPAGSDWLLEYIERDDVMFDEEYGVTDYADIMEAGKVKGIDIDSSMEEFEQFIKDNWKIFDGTYLQFYPFSGEPEFADVNDVVKGEYYVIPNQV